jgi:hypothetical protein
MKKFATTALFGLFASASAFAGTASTDIIVQRPIIVQLLGLLGL